jgi:uncharacterized protein YaaN involved in tellurite resistance
MSDEMHRETERVIEYIRKELEVMDENRKQMAIKEINESTKEINYLTKRIYELTKEINELTEKVKGGN